MRVNVLGTIRHMIIIVIICKLILIVQPPCQVYYNFLLFYIYIYIHVYMANLISWINWSHNVCYSMYELGTKLSMSLMLAQYT